MKMLTVRQPWAWLIVTGAKPVENRVWRTEYRGPLLIIASKRLVRTSLAEIAQRYRVTIPDDLQCGGVVGMCQLDEIVTEHASPFFDGPKGDDGRPNYGFVLSRAKQLPFIEWRGSLMIRDVPPPLLNRVQRHL